MALKNCQLCDTEYRIKNSAAAKSKFCSKTCHSKAKERKVTLSCVECGTDFTVPYCHRNRKQRCSRNCIKEFRRRQMTEYVSDPEFISASRRGQATRRVHHESGTVMRSGWEVSFAQWLDEQDLTWAYEPTVFDLGPFSYLPDFWVEEWDTYVEIKPTWRLEEGQPKMEAFREAGYPLVVLTEEELAA